MILICNKLNINQLIFIIHFINITFINNYIKKGGEVVIMAECKNYAPENIYKITKNMVEEFADKARCLAKERFQNKKLRLGYFSKHGFEEKLKTVFDSYGIFLGN